MILLVKYSVKDMRVSVSEITFVPIEFLDWDCLTVGALGWGQIQIANSNYIKIRPQYPRKAWMLEFCEVMFEFYPKEIGKIHGRLEYFEKVVSYFEIEP